MSSILRASTYLLKIGEALTTIGFTSRWSVKHANHLHSNKDPDKTSHVYSGSVDLLFRDRNIDTFIEHVKYLKKLDEREQRITKLKSESTEFAALLDAVDFALDLSKE